MVYVLKKEYKHSVNNNNVKWDSWCPNLQII